MNTIEELKERILIESQTIPNRVPTFIPLDDEMLKANEEKINKLERDMGYKL